MRALIAGLALVLASKGARGTNALDSVHGGRPSSFAACCCELSIVHPFHVHI